MVERSLRRGSGRNAGAHRRRGARERVVFRNGTNRIGRIFSLRRALGETSRRDACETRLVFVQRAFGFAQGPRHAGRQVAGSRRRAARDGGGVSVFFFVRVFCFFVRNFKRRDARERREGFVQPDSAPPPFAARDASQPRGAYPAAKLRDRPRDRTRGLRVFRVARRHRLETERLAQNVRFGSRFETASRRKSGCAVRVVRAAVVRSAQLQISRAALRVRIPEGDLSGFFLSVRRKAGKRRPVSGHPASRTQGPPGREVRGEHLGRVRVVTVVVVHRRRRRFRVPDAVPRGRRRLDRARLGKRRASRRTDAAAHHEDVGVGGRTGPRRAARHEHVPRMAMTFARPQPASHRPGEVDASPTPTRHEDLIREDLPLWTSVSAGERLPARHAEPGDRRRPRATQ